MYQIFFGLTQRPFSATPDTHILYNSSGVRVCLNELEQSLRLGEGIGLLTAAAGTGKTLLCKVLGERLANDPIPVLLLNSTYATRSALLQAILFELGRPYVRLSEQELRLELVSCGRKIAESQTGIALIVDEAHLLGEHILEELRALTNFMYQSRPIFRVVLSGQLSLEDILARRSMEAVNQRLKCHVTLETLTRQESLEYIITRVEHAGGNVLELFTERALELIIHAADGLPRCLNQLCDHACLLASIAGETTIQPHHVREALADLQKLPLHWNTPLPAVDPLTEMRQASGPATREKKSLRPTASVTTRQEAAPVLAAFETSAPSQPASTPATSVTTATTGSTSVFEIGGTEAPPTVPPAPQSVPRSSEVASSTGVESVEEQPVLARIEEVAAEQLSQIEQSEELLDLEEELLEEVFGGECAPVDMVSAEQNGMSTEELELPVLNQDYDLTCAELEDELLEEVRGIQTELTAEFVSLEEEHSEPVEAVSHETSAQSETVPAPTLRRDIPALPEVEEIHDHYALLDARRIRQLHFSPRPHFVSAEKRDQAARIAESQVGQAVLDAHDEAAALLSIHDEDYVPSPEQVLQKAIESAAARFDVVDPDPEHPHYASLYSQLRQRSR